MQYTKCIKAYLQCSCGEIFTIWRIGGRQKKRDHIKHLYCWKCKKITPHIELKEWGLFEKEILEREQYDNN